MRLILSSSEIPDDTDLWRAKCIGSWSTCGGSQGSDDLDLARLTLCNFFALFPVLLDLCSKEGNNSHASIHETTLSFGEKIGH